MSTNIFSIKRFQLLAKQHFIHNAQFLLLSSGAYVGVIFIALSLAQVSNRFEPHQFEGFQALLITFVTVFGILYVGHSFPAFRSKESTISYLMLPASSVEKFLFEFVSRIVIILVTLPLLFWITFHLQGYFFSIFAFTEHTFKPVGIQYLIKIDDNVPALIYFLSGGGVLFVLSLAFTGSAMFTKQPLVKSLFAVAVVVLLFGGYSYIMIEHVGIGRYNPPDKMLLVPMEEEQVLTFFAIVLFAASAVMLFVAYCKLKEREV